MLILTSGNFHENKVKDCIQLTACHFSHTKFCYKCELPESKCCLKIFTVNYGELRHIILPAISFFLAPILSLCQKYKKGISRENLQYYCVTYINNQWG